MRSIALLLCLLLLPVRPALAWGWLGHELVAEMAERALSPPALAEARRLLALEGSHSLAEVSGWADRVREEDAYRWSSPLHYVNFPGERCPRDGAICPDGDCVVAAVVRFRARLADRSLPDAQRLEALKFLVHFVGDIHQPLHAGRAADKGGNTWQTQWNGKGGSLHGLWDYELLDTPGLAREAYADRLLQSPLPPPGDAEPAAWALESCAMVNAPGFYPTRHAVPRSYVDAQLPQAEARLRLASARLVRELEQALAPAATASATTN